MYSLLAAVLFGVFVQAAAGSPAPASGTPASQEIGTGQPDSEIQSGILRETGASDLNTPASRSDSEPVDQLNQAPIPGSVHIGATGLLLTPPTALMGALAILRSVRKRPQYKGRRKVRIRRQMAFI